MTDPIETRLARIDEAIRQPIHERYDDLRALVDDLLAENGALAAWQCLYLDGQTGLVCDEHGNQSCALAARVTKLEAELATVLSREADTTARYDAKMDAIDGTKNDRPHS